MKTTNKPNNARSIIVYTSLVVIALIAVFFSITSYIYEAAENDGFETLHIETKEIKEQLTLQLISDRENLTTMANFAGKLYTDGEGFDLILKSFKSIGLIENIGILMPDNTFLTKAGASDASEYLSFQTEAERGEYVSGRVTDITYPDQEVIRSAVPIKSGGNTIAILYGVINLTTLNNRYKPYAESLNANLYIIEQSSGNFIIDTSRKTLGNVSSLQLHKSEKTYTHKHLSTAMEEGTAGYYAFLSQQADEYFYVHYAPIEIGDWQIMLAQPERIVFQEAIKTGKTITLTFLTIVAIMVAYLWLLFSSERKQSKMNLCASEIRKLLLGVNQQISVFSSALERVCNFAKSPSAFFVDTDGEDYHYITPSQQDNLLSEENRKYFIIKLLNYAAQHRKNHGITVHGIRLRANGKLKRNTPELYNFFKKHGIKRVCYAIVINNNSTTSILGVINPRMRMRISILLKDISVCFSMAVYNKKYLDKTKFIAATDSLTGLSNRTAYKRDISRLDEAQPTDFSCIYIDVNELHIINNKYGHAAGDGMLLAVSNALKQIFANDKIYRIGGDEFLVFAENTPKDIIEAAITRLINEVEAMDYHISVGMDYRSKNIDTSETVKEAEKRMYEAKARYYQQKEQKSISEVKDHNIEHISTGINEFDSLLSIISKRYLGIYCVSLQSDTARRVLMPSYFNHFSENEDKFSRAITHYIHDMVSPDYQKAFLNFLNYDAIKNQLSEGKIPNITYRKIEGDIVNLSVHPISNEGSDTSETLWIFEKQI